MEDEQERLYLDGQRSVYVEQIEVAMKGLGYPEHMSIARMVIERENVIRALRSVCEDFGSNDWDEHLVLHDVIEKHLADHLHKNN